MIHFVYSHLTLKVTLKKQTQHSIALLEKLITAKLAFYGTWTFITVFTRTLHLTLFSARWIHSQPYFFKIHFNVILPCTPSSPKWASLQVFRQILRAFLVSMYAACSAHLILFDFIILIIFVEVTTLLIYLVSRLLPRQFWMPELCIWVISFLFQFHQLKLKFQYDSKFNIQKRFLSFGSQTVSLICISLLSLPGQSNY